MRYLNKYLTVNYPDEEFLIADGFYSAFIGINRGFNGGQLIYDREKCLSVLQRQGMSWSEAFEFFEFNVAGAYVGEKTPIYLETIKSLSCKKLKKKVKPVSRQMSSRLQRVKEMI